MLLIEWCVLNEIPISIMDENDDRIIPSVLLQVPPDTPVGERCMKLLSSTKLYLEMLTELDDPTYHWEIALENCETWWRG